jgi:hypothetical protein
MSLKNSSYAINPVDAFEMNVQIVASFDAIAHTETLSFPHAGTWFECYASCVVSVSGTTIGEKPRPSEYRVYTDIPLSDPVTSVEGEGEAVFSVSPNPVRDEFYIGGDKAVSASLYSVDGRLDISKRPDSIRSVGSLFKGLCILKIHNSETVKQVKILANDNRLRPNAKTMRHNFLSINGMHSIGPRTKKTIAISACRASVMVGRNEKYFSGTPFLQQER